MIEDKNFFQGGKTKSIFEYLIISQRDFVCWWNLHLNMPDYLNPFMPSGNNRSYTLKLLDGSLLKYVWPFVPPGAKGLRERNICERKNCGIKACELNLGKWKKCGKNANEQVFIAFTYTFTDFILLWHKIT